MKKILYLFLIFNLFIISACGSSGNSSSGSPNTVIPSYTISINGPDTVYTSSKNNYTITTVPEGITVTDIEWLIDNTTIATIDASTGVLTAKNTAGQVTITANANGKTATKLVNIIKQLEITGNNITAINGIITLKVLYNTTNNITWSSSNPAVATVENGVVTGKSAGSTNITVTENGKTSAPFTITIVDMPNGYEIVDGAYHVYSVAGFKKWVEAVTTNSSTDCNLYSDLDFSGETNNEKIIYAGTFNGNGHIIKNYTIPFDSGFFKGLDGGKIANVTFDNASAVLNRNDYTINIGIIAPVVIYSTIENVHVTNSTYTINNGNGYNIIGMLTGIAEGPTTIKNCSVTNSKITANTIVNGIGGIVGEAFTSSDEVVISGCFVDNVTISAQGTTFESGGIGGITGTFIAPPHATNSITGCGVTNTTITNNGTYGYVGGLVGHGNHGNFSASYFYGSLSNTSGYSTGLDFGYFNNTNGTASANFVKKQNGTVDTIIDQNGTTLVDNTTVTWIDAVNNMNQYLTDNNYTDFSFRYDKNKGYPVIDYAK